ncbi:hypothetical protein [Pseudarthrobacter sp. MDT1-22]
MLGFVEKVECAAFAGRIGSSMIRHPGSTAKVVNGDDIAGR